MARWWINPDIREEAWPDWICNYMYVVIKSRPEERDVENPQIDQIISRCSFLSVYTCTPKIGLKIRVFLRGSILIQIILGYFQLWIYFVLYVSLKVNLSSNFQQYGLQFIMHHISWRMGTYGMNTEDSDQLGHPVQMSDQYLQQSSRNTEDSIKQSGLQVSTLCRYKYTDTHSEL